MDIPTWILGVGFGWGGPCMALIPSTASASVKWEPQYPPLVHLPDEHNKRPQSLMKVAVQITGYSRNSRRGSEHEESQCFQN